ncbi:hypothetical protein MSS93_02335 [Deinococcus radiodurans]|nr:hypothetical protein MSS93_02335 [Deinococcus radiodurans]
MQGQAPDRVILLGSFSKSLAPVTRSGFVVAPPEVTEVLSRTRPLTDRVPGVLDALALADVLASGAYTRHLRRARALLAHRGGALLTALRTELPSGKRCLPAPGCTCTCACPRQRRTGDPGQRRAAGGGPVPGAVRGGRRRTGGAARLRAPQPRGAATGGAAAAGVVLEPLTKRWHSFLASEASTKHGAERTCKAAKQRMKRVAVPLPTHASFGELL